MTLSFRYCQLSILNSVIIPRMPKQNSSDYAAFRSLVEKARNIAVITGAGISAESGIPTFRGAGGFWRQYQAQDLANPIAFRRNPSLVWEFYHYRRELVLTKLPNPAHYVLAKFEEKCKKSAKILTVITQNVDELHKTAGTRNLIELHGSLFKTKCTKCQEIQENRHSPICDALSGRGAPDANAISDRIDEALLPRCKTCDGLLRPFIVWFGENLDPSVISSAQKSIAECDLCLVVGTSAVVYPAAMLAPEAAARGISVAEFNVEPTSTTEDFDFYFQGPAGLTLPKALGYA